MTPAPAIHPSILNADQAHLADELDRVADADGLHVDIIPCAHVLSRSVATYGVPFTSAVVLVSKKKSIVPQTDRINIPSADKTLR